MVSYYNITDLNNNPYRIDDYDTLVFLLEKQAELLAEKVAEQNATIATLNNRLNQQNASIELLSGLIKIQLPDAFHKIIDYLGGE